MLTSSSNAPELTNAEVMLFLQVGHKIAIIAQRPAGSDMSNYHSVEFS